MNQVIHIKHHLPVGTQVMLPLVSGVKESKNSDGFLNPAWQNEPGRLTTRELLGDPEPIPFNLEDLRKKLNLVARLYVLQGLNLAAKGSGGDYSDPYLLIECGSVRIDDSSNYLSEVMEAGELR